MYVLLLANALSRGCIGLIKIEIIAGMGAGSECCIRGGADLGILFAGWGGNRNTI
jgi:hypothetical protein